MIELYKTITSKQHSDVDVTLSLTLFQLQLPELTQSKYDDSM